MWTSAQLNQANLKPKVILQLNLGVHFKKKKLMYSVK